MLNFLSQRRPKTLNSLWHMFFGSECTIRRNHQLVRVCYTTEFQSDSPSVLLDSFIYMLLLLTIRRIPTTEAV